MRTDDKPQALGGEEKSFLGLGDGGAHQLTTHSWAWPL